MKMIKHASLFKWPHNGATKIDVKSSKSQSQKLWIHPPATLQNGHIAYLVKYFGNVEVNQSKGIEIVKESINKLKLIHPIKKSDGNKIPKVELTISVNGVAIQEPKSKQIYCQFPLHRISYCADDKTEKKFFSFIAKDVDTDKHLCFVFMSEKMSEEIILTIGQAFDLAYAKFIETSGRELEIRKQLIMLQKKVCDLEEENKKLKERLSKHEPVELVTAPDESNQPEKGSTNGHSKLLKEVDPIPVPALQPPPNAKHRSTQGPVSLIDVDLECNPTSQVCFDSNALINDLIDEDFNPRASDQSEVGNVESTNGKPLDFLIDQIGQEKDIFGSKPFEVQDPFGMGQFNTNDLDSAIVRIDKKLAEMRYGFSQGLSADGFNMDS